VNAKKSTQQRPRLKLCILINNHFDPMWRRCWERHFTIEGQTYVAYADLEAYYMLDNLALAREHNEYKFHAESSFIARQFLERYPDTRDELLQLAREGRFGVTGGGETIVDSNMILGESLIRNYLVGLLWVEKTFGQRTRHAVRNDAFGNSAQLPQILRGCEIPWATGMSYTRAQGRYWRGLDGSTILHATLPIAAQGGGNTKYPPCPTCRGTGVLNPDEDPNSDLCPECEGRGIDDAERAWLPEELLVDALPPSGVALIRIVPEELLPNPEIITWAESLQDRFDVAFALEEDLFPYVQTWIDAIDDPDPQEVHPSVELNPNNSGCWVTRIRTKQTCRRQEYEILGTEALAVMATLRGKSYPAAEIDKIWQSLFFTMFHDAITATHVDPAYDELTEIWERNDIQNARLRQEVVSNLVMPAADSVAVLNPRADATTETCTVVLDAVPEQPALIDDAGQPVPVVDLRQDEEGDWQLTFVAKDVPAFGARHYRLIAGKSAVREETTVWRNASPGTDTTVRAAGHAVIENARFRVEADDSGITEIHDKQLERTLATTAAFRPLELILEHDEGSPWATLHPDQQRTGLAPFTKLMTLDDDLASSPGLQRLVFEVSTPREMGFSGSALYAVVTVALLEGLERIQVEVGAYWDAFNHRVRMAVPVPFAGDHVYEIPYGMLTRTPYEPSFGWAGANGDWPAINWAGVEGEAASVALFNNGVPSYRMEPMAETENSPAGELLLISLLRSPTLPAYLHEPEFYTMTAWDGMRDAGAHAFQFALTAYDRPFAESTVVSDAESFNAGLIALPGRAHLPAMPALTADAVRLAAVKWAEEGHAMILRLHEYRGQGGRATLDLSFPVKSATRVNMLERRPEPLMVDHNTLSLTLRPWEIATLRLEM
jgi:alpha-mannosidase